VSGLLLIEDLADPLHATTRVGAPNGVIDPAEPESERFSRRTTSTSTVGDRAARQPPPQHLYRTGPPPSRAASPWPSWSTTG